MHSTYKTLCNTKTHEMLQCLGRRSTFQTHNRCVQLRLAAVLDSDSTSGIRVPIHNLSSPPASDQLAASSNQTLHRMTKTLRMRRAACPVRESPPHPFQASCLPRSWIATPASSNPAEYSPTWSRWCHTERSCVGRSAVSSAAIWQLLNTRCVSVGGSASRKSRLTQHLRKALVKRCPLIWKLTIPGPAGRWAR